MVNLLTWARTGVETPAYPSDDARDEQIRQTAEQNPADLKSDVIAGTVRLADAVREMPAHAWAATVRARQGHEISGADIVWMRCRECYVHSIDLNSGIEWREVPDEVLAGIADEVFRSWDRRQTVPDVVTRLVGGQPKKEATQSLRQLKKLLEA